MACHLAGVDDRRRDLRHGVRRRPHQDPAAAAASTTTSSAARSSSPSTATRPGRRPRCGRSRATSSSSARPTSRSSPTACDPCDLRLAEGDAAVRELVARRVPLYRFVLAQRRLALRPRPRRRPGRRAARGRPAGRSDPRPVQGRRRSPASWPAWSASRSTRRAPRSAAPRARGPRPTGPGDAAAPSTRRRRPSAPRPPMPDLRDPRFTLERETLKLVAPAPGRDRPARRRPRAPSDFTHPTTARSAELVAAAGGPAAGVGDRRLGRRAARQRDRPGGLARRCQRARRRAAAVAEGAGRARTSRRTSSGSGS